MNPFRQNPRYYQAYHGPRPLSDGEMRAAFAVPDDQTQWRATMQKIEELILVANRQAQVSVASHAISSSCIGGAEWLSRLRNELIALREGGLEGRKAA